MYTVDTLVKNGVRRPWGFAILLVLAPACAAQRYSPESVAEAHAAMNAAIARGEIECRTETYTGSMVPLRVCYTRGERAYRRAIGLRNFQGNSPQPPPPLAWAREKKQ